MSLVGRFDAASQQASEYREQFLQHSSLWKDNREDALEKFLTTGEVKNQQPSLEQFQQEVSQNLVRYT